MVADARCWTCGGVKIPNGTTKGEPMCKCAPTVTKLYPVEVGENFRFDADELLDAAKGQDFKTLAIIGQTKDDEIWLTGSANAGKTMILLELAKRRIVP